MIYFAQMLTLQTVFMELDKILTVFIKSDNRKGESQKVGHDSEDRGEAAGKEIRAEIRGKEVHLLFR